MKGQQMSKMSQLHMELTEQANEMGYESIEQAEKEGEVIDYTKGRFLTKEELRARLDKEMEEAHKAHLIYKQTLIDGLKDVLTLCNAIESSEAYRIVNEAIKYIQEN